MLTEPSDHSGAQAECRLGTQTLGRAPSQRGGQGGEGRTARTGTAGTRVTWPHTPTWPGRQERGARWGCEHLTRPPSPLFHRSRGHSGSTAPRTAAPRSREAEGKVGSEAGLCPVPRAGQPTPPGLLGPGPRLQGDRPGAAPPPRWGRPASPGDGWQLPPPRAGAQPGTGDAGPANPEPAGRAPCWQRRALHLRVPSHKHLSAQGSGSSPDPSPGVHTGPLLLLTAACLLSGPRASCPHIRTAHSPAGARHCPPSLARTV